MHLALAFFPFCRKKKEKEKEKKEKKNELRLNPIGFGNHVRCFIWTALIFFNQSWNSPFLVQESTNLFHQTTKNIDVNVIIVICLDLRNKISGLNLVKHVNWELVFKLYVVRCGSKNTH